MKIYTRYFPIVRIILNSLLTIGSYEFLVYIRNMVFIKRIVMIEKNYFAQLGLKIKRQHHELKSNIMLIVMKKRTELFLTGIFYGENCSEIQYFIIDCMNIKQITLKSFSLNRFVHSYFNLTV